MGCEWTVRKNFVLSGYLNLFNMSLDNNARSKELRQIPTKVMHTCRPTPRLLLRLQVAGEALSLSPDLSCPAGM